MLLRLRDDGHAGAHPGPDDVLLLVEVSDTSIRYERAIELPLYACHGVAYVWILDLEDRLLRVYRRPAVDDYEAEITVAAPGAMPLPGLPDVDVDLSGLLG